jgi:prolyl oligopeptidase
MRKRSTSSCAALAATLLPTMTTADTVTTTTAAQPADDYLWLEEVEGPRALDWVRAQNERSLAELTKDARYQRFYEQALAIAEDRARIPLGTLRAGWVYNFWQDDKNVRGLWRRAPLESYREPEPKWQVLLDLDALATSEGRNWVFKGATCLPPEGRRCLVSLSDGGKDATTLREFDIESRAFVAGGFEIPEAKTSVEWLDRDTLLVATDWGEGSLTASGYPFIVKSWKRGTPLADAKEIHRGQASDVAAVPFSLDGSEDERLLGVVEADTFFTSSYFRLAGDGKVERLTLPRKATPQGLYRGELLFTIEEDWKLAGREWARGALLSAPAGEMARATPTVRLVFEPGPRDSIEGVAVTSAGPLVASYSNVRGRVLRFTLENGRWTSVKLPLPENGAVSIATAEPRAGEAFVLYEDFLQPDTLYAVEVAANRTRPVKSLPPKFEAKGIRTEQFEAVSRDGTRVPYFVVRPQTLAADGAAPTLLYGYGGFQVSELPSYSPVVGKLWLEQGGVYVVANIRGGGEFGPAWHQAGLKTRRQVVYDDFIAVAEDLVRRKITSPEHLGIMGGSNGGLLMGVMLTQRPELFGAAVVQVPLLDMLRYHLLLAGASWVDEYGSPDVPEERAWLEQLSPFHRLGKRADFPKPFFVTSTKDDRVHPAHARKFAAKMASLGMPFYYYENIDGGHSAAANLRERAKRQALEFTYLWRELGK